MSPLTNKQIDNFKEAAREPETDDEALYNERLNKIAKAPVKKQFKD